MAVTRRSFLTGLGAVLVAAPAIVRAGSLMPVKQMLILPDRIEDITFPIEGFARTSPEILRYYTQYEPEVFGEWKRSNWSGKTVPLDASDRWMPLIVGSV